jgi:hypothetical protein
MRRGPGLDIDFLAPPFGLQTQAGVRPGLRQRSWRVARALRSVHLGAIPVWVADFPGENGKTGEVV